MPDWPRSDTCRFAARRRGARCPHTLSTVEQNSSLRAVHRGLLAISAARPDRPRLASEIVKRAEEEGRHLRELDQGALKAAVDYRTRGQWMGFATVAGILGISGLARVEGAYWVAGIALTGINLSRRHNPNGRLKSVVQACPRSIPADSRR